MSDQSSVYTAYNGNSYLFGGNAPYVEEMYEAYLDNPGSVPDNWRAYFDALQNVPAVDGSCQGATCPTRRWSTPSRSAPSRAAPGGGRRRRRPRPGRKRTARSR